MAAEEPCNPLNDTTARVAEVADPAKAMIAAFTESISAANLSDLGATEAAALGERAAHQAIASLSWSRIVGDRLDTSEVVSLLGVSRQALAKRRRTGSILGLTGASTTWYPSWQFDTDTQSIRPQTRMVIGAIRAVVGDDVEPYEIAAWATTVQQDLDGVSPADWMAAGGADAQLLVAAQRAAGQLAQ